MTKPWMGAALAGAVLLCCGYVAYPCVTLYRLDRAVSSGSARALGTLIDWPSVRRGIDADLARGDADDLPTFGAGFMRTIAVKSDVTPENVLAALHTLDQRTPSGTTPWPSGVSVEGPWAVTVDLGTMRVRMELRGGAWRVTRAWLPETVLTEARAFARR